MAECPDIRRLENGAIDYDFYRRRADAFRRHAMRHAWRLRHPAISRRLAVVLIAATALLVAASAATP